MSNAQATTHVGYFASSFGFDAPSPAARNTVLRRASISGRETP
jgi:hypothetical protein